MQRISKLCAIALAFLVNLSLADDGMDGELHGCATQIKGYYYNFHELSKSRDHKDTYSVQFTDGSYNKTIDFNICEATAHQCGTETYDDYANMYWEDQCQHLTGQVDEGNTPQGAKATFINDEHPELGVNLAYTLGESCNGSFYQFDLQINCVENDIFNQLTYDYSTEQSTSCYKKIIMNSAHGCATMNSGPLGQFVEDYYLVFAIPAIIFGLFLVVFGGQYPKTSLFLTTTFSIMTILLLLLWYDYLPDSSPEWLVWITLVNCLFIGAGIGIAAAYYPRFGVELLGTMLGVLAGFCVYKILWISIPDEELTIVMGLCLGFGGVFGLVLAFFIFDYVMIITTSTIGSYSLIRGIGLIAGGYTNEIEMSMARQNGELNKLPESTFFYMTGMILLLILSLVGQIDYRNKHIEKFTFGGRFTESNYNYFKKKMRGKDYDPDFEEKMHLMAENTFSSETV